MFQQNMVVGVPEWLMPPTPEGELQMIQRPMEYVSRFQYAKRLNINTKVLISPRPCIPCPPRSLTVPQPTIHPGGRYHRIHIRRKERAIRESIRPSVPRKKVCTSCMWTCTCTCDASSATCPNV